ncbi:MAG: HlyD family secretion protein [Crocinitomicaceae bacterium]
MPNNPTAHIENQSDEVKEIMSHAPNWMIRYGITVMFLLIVMLIFISYFIKYPDTIQGAVTISTKQPPVELVSKVSGEIEFIYKKNNTFIKKGEVIASVRTTLSEESKQYLEEIIDVIEHELENENTLYMDFSDQGLTFGSMQEVYNSLKNNVLEYQSYLEDDAATFEIQNLKGQIQNYVILRSVSYQQLNSAKKDLEHTKSRFLVDQQLYDKKVISKSDLYEKEKALIQTENNLGNYKKASIQSSIQINNLEKQLYQIESTSKKKKNVFIRRIKSEIASIKNQLQLWGSNYQFISPADGTLTYIEKLSLFQHIESGTVMFAVVSKNQNYQGYIEVPKTGFGKLKLGQKVRLKIDKYPAYEYGQLEGEVSDISLLPNKETYRVEFNLMNGMVSTYKNKFEYSPEMTGVADVITDDIRLITRIFNKFKKF